MEKDAVEIVVPQETLYELLVQGLPFDRKGGTEKAIRKAFIKLYTDYLAGKVRDDREAEEKIAQELEKEGYEVRNIWISLKIKEKPKAGTYHKHTVSIGKTGQFSEDFAVYVILEYDSELYGEGKGGFEFHIFVVPYP
jgi:hypothetical protein